MSDRNDVPLNSRAIADGTIELSRATEQLRQEALVFDRRLDQDRHWFHVRVGMAALAGGIIVAVFIAALIMVWSKDLPSSVRTAAATALIADVLAVAATTWKVVLGDGSFSNLTAVTQYDPTHP